MLDRRIGGLEDWGIGGLGNYMESSVRLRIHCASLWMSSEDQNIVVRPD